MNRYVLYDYLQVSGGAERLSLDLTSGMPGSQLVVSRIFPDAKPLMPERVLDVGALRCLGTPLTRPLGRIAEAAFVFTNRTRFLEEAQSVLYSGFYAPFAVHNQKRGRRVYYCHTPPRHAYDMRQYYLNKVPAALRPVANGVLDVLKKRYERSLSRMDCIVANSENVRGRLQRDLGMDAKVIHPPIDTDRFVWTGQQDYFISLARLEPKKRIDRVIEAFRAMPDQRLVVASGGRDEARLRELAADAPNVTFTSWLSEARLRELVGAARAAIYIPQDEDFGMSPVEAMSAGKPVIGVREGGLTETVVDGETGVLVPPEATVESLVEAICSMTAKRALSMREACEARSVLFSKKVFLERMADILE